MNRTTLGSLVLVCLALFCDLAVASCATVRFYAPGDDGVCGRADHYEVRYSDYLLNEGNWAQGGAPNWLPVPASPGVLQEVIIPDLEPLTTYNIGIRAFDEAGNGSEILFFEPIRTPDDNCTGRTGNADCSTDDKIGLPDLTRMIDYVYVSHRPLCCPDMANTDGSPDGTINLADIMRLIDYLYVSGQETADCW